MSGDSPDAPVIARRRELQAGRDLGSRTGMACGAPPASALRRRSFPIRRVPCILSPCCTCEAVGREPACFRTVADPGQRRRCAYVQRVGAIPGGFVNGRFSKPCRGAIDLSPDWIELRTGMRRSLSDHHMRPFMATIPDDTAAPGKPSGLLLSLRQFFHEPLAIGSAFPASRHLVSRLLDPLDWARIRTVVEYGPGTGPLTRGALDRMSRSSRLLAMDVNADFTDYLRRTIADPRLIAVTASAASVREILAERGLGSADLIITGIPFSTLSPSERADVLDRSMEIMSPAGTFAAYQMRGTLGTDLARRVRQIRRSYVWWNIPPCRLYWAKGPNVSR